MTSQQPIAAAKAVQFKGAVHCPICTHTVDADLAQNGRRIIVRPGQKCSRCASALDAAYILTFDKAA